MIILILLLFNGFGIAISQKVSVYKECQNDSLKIYSDSLWHLMVNYQPKKVINISDSLLIVHDRLICPDIIRIKAHRAYAYERLYNFETALEIYNEILNTAAENKFIEEEIYIKISLARLYEAIDRPEICAQHLADLDKLFKTYDDKYQMSHYYVRCASYHRIYKDKNLARAYAKKAILLGEESRRLGSLAGGNLLLGLLSDDFEESIEYLEKSSEFMHEEGDYVGFLIQKMNIASRYLEKTSYVKPRQILESLVEDIEKLSGNGKNYYQVKSYQSRLLARIYEGMGQKDSLILALKNINEYSTLFGNITNQEKINQLVLDKAVENEKEKVVYERRRSKLLSYGLIILLGATMLLLRFYLLNKTKNTKIEDQKSTISSQYKKLQVLYKYQTTLLSEVHHRIKNNLQLIISLLTLQKAKLGNDINDGLLDMLSNRIASISLIHEQLYSQKEFEKVDVGLYIRDLIKNFKSLTIERNVNIDYKMEDISLNLETIIPLGLIWSELISNSLKYTLDTEELKIYFELYEKDDIYSMNYHDNGVGYPDGHFKANSKGMGFTIINSLTRQLSAEVSTFNENGAHFTLKFKQKIISPL